MYDETKGKKNVKKYSPIYKLVNSKRKIIITKKKREKQY